MENLKSGNQVKAEIWLSDGRVLSFDFTFRGFAFIDGFIYAGYEGQEKLRNLGVNVSEVEYIIV